MAAEQAWVSSTEPSGTGPSPTHVYVCVTCRAGPDEEPRSGARLFAAVRDALADDALVSVAPVECLSVCKRPCSIAFAAPGKWTYVYGDLPADCGAGIVRDAARLYADAPDGLIPWRLRPDPIKRGVVARIPPLAANVRGPTP